MLSGEPLRPCSPVITPVQREIEWRRDEAYFPCPLYSKLAIYSDVLCQMWGRVLFDRTRFQSSATASVVVECVGSDHAVFVSTSGRTVADVTGWFEWVASHYSIDAVPIATWTIRSGGGSEFGLLVGVGLSELWYSSNQDTSCAGVFKGDLLESVEDFSSGAAPAVYYVSPGIVASFEDSMDDPPF